MPDEPHYGICETEPRTDCFNKSNCLCAEKWKPYRAALQAAKASSVPIQDQERAKKMIELLLYEKRKELTFQDISSLDVMANVIYGPFTVEYRIQGKHTSECAFSRTPWKCTCDPEPVAILYDDTPEKERPDYINNEFKKVSKSDLKSALREVNLKNKEIRDSYEDPTRLDFRIKDSRGFPTGDVIDGAKVKVDDDPIIAVMRIARMDNLMPIQRYEYIKSQFTITRKQ